MAKSKRKKRSILFSRKFYCFKDDQVIRDLIEEKRGAIKFATLEPKYAWIINKGLVSKSFNKEYKEKGFKLKKKANRLELERDADQKFQTLSYLFGGSDLSIKIIIYNLIEWGVLKVHKKYLAGVSATSYKFTPQWEAKPVTMRRYTGKKGSVIYKLNERWNERLKHPIVRVTQEIYDTYVTMSEEGIRFFQRKYPDPRVDHVAEALLNGTFDDNKEALLDALIGFAVDPDDVVLLSFFTRDLYCNPVGKGKRLYHSITNLKREYRKFVLLDGKPLLEVDITNSQPTFAAAFLIKLHRQVFPSHPLPADLVYMMELCRNGQFYERIAGEAGITLTEETRSSFKEDFFEQVFYARVSDSVRKIKTAFKSLFPAAFEMINGIKRENYKRFPQIMQDQEAEIMVYQVYKTLLEESHVVLVLHDAILCSTAEAVQRSKDLIQKAFKDTFNQEISFKDK